MPKRYLEIGWQAYRRAVVPADAGPAQIAESRRAFFAGAMVVFETVFSLLSPDDAEPTAKDLQNMQDIHDELMAYSISTPRENPLIPTQWIPENRFEVRHAAAEKMLKEIGNNLRDGCPPGYGFVLLIASFGENGNMFYTSNSQRADVVKMMREFIAKFEEN